MELVNWLVENLVLWTVCSFLILFLWGMMINDPDSSEVSNIILTVICGILALPLVFIGGVIMLVIFVVIEIQKSKNKIGK